MAAEFTPAQRQGVALVNDAGADYGTGNPFPVSAVIDQLTMAGSPSRSDVSVAASSTLVLAANTARKSGSIVSCDTTAVSYFKLGTGASSTDFYAAVDGKTTVPGIFLIPDGYLGAIYGCGSAATGSWRVTEML